MRISKINNTFNDYRVEMSFGQLKAIQSALSNDHSDPMSDEMYAEISYYLENVPGPGEDKEDFDKREEVEKAAEDGGKLGPPDEDMSEVPVGDEGGAAAEPEHEPEGSRLPPPPSDDDESEPEGGKGHADIEDEEVSELAKLAVGRPGGESEDRLPPPPEE